MVQCVLCHEFNAIAEQNARKKKVQIAYGIRYDNKTKLQLVVDQLLGPSHEAVLEHKKFQRGETNKVRIILGLGPYVPTTHRWLELLSIWQLVFTMTVNCLPLLLGLGLLDLWQTYMLKGNTEFTNSMMPNFPIFAHPAAHYAQMLHIEGEMERKKLFQEMHQC